MLIWTEAAAEQCLPADTLSSDMYRNPECVSVCVRGGGCHVTKVEEAAAFFFNTIIHTFLSIPT